MLNNSSWVSIFFVFWFFLKKIIKHCHFKCTLLIFLISVCLFIIIWSCFWDLDFDPGSRVRVRALLTEDVVWDVVVCEVRVSWRQRSWRCSRSRARLLNVVREVVMWRRCRLSMFEIRSSFARPCLKTLHSVFSLRSLRGKKCFFLLLFWCAPFCDAQLVWVRGSLFLSFCLYVFSLGENVLLWERERLCIDSLSSFSFCLFVLFSLLPLGCERLLLLDDYSPFSRLKGWMKSDLGVSTCC